MKTSPSKEKHLKVQDEVHSLCQTCVQSCKQASHVRIVSCPNFQKEWTLWNGKEKKNSKRLKKESQPPLETSDPPQVTHAAKQLDHTPSLLDDLASD